MTTDVLNWLLNTSVLYGEILVPGRQVENLLARHCSSLGVVSGMDAIPFSTPGSATTVRFRGRYFLVCTRHQLRGATGIENVCLMIPDGGLTRCITSGGAAWFEGVYDGEQHEIAIFDFTEPCTEFPELRGLFFDFHEQHPTVPAEMIVGFVAYGYPTAFTNWDVEQGRVDLGKKRVACRFVGGGSDDAVHVLAPTTPLDFDPDGMSGGPVFCILDTGDGFALHLAGVTVTGGRERLRVIKTGAIQLLLTKLTDRAAESDPIAGHISRN